MKIFYFLKIYLTLRSRCDQPNNAMRITNYLFTTVVFSFFSRKNYFLKANFTQKMRVAANLTMMYTDVPLLSRFVDSKWILIYKLPYFSFRFEKKLCRYVRAAADGFKLVEVALPYSEKAEDLKKAADYNGLKHVLINAVPGIPLKLWRIVIFRYQATGKVVREESLHFLQRRTGLRSQSTLRSTMRRLFSVRSEIRGKNKRSNCIFRVHVMAGVPTGSDLVSAATVFVVNIGYAAEKLREVR